MSCPYVRVEVQELWITYQLFFLSAWGCWYLLWPVWAAEWSHFCRGSSPSRCSEVSPCAFYNSHLLHCRKSSKVHLVKQKICFSSPNAIVYRLEMNLKILWGQMNEMKPWSFPAFSLYTVTDVLAYVGAEPVLAFQRLLRQMQKHICWCNNLLSKSPLENRKQKEKGKTNVVRCRSRLL